MSRRTHVVRTDDHGGVGNSRSLGGGEILCSEADCGHISNGIITTITSMTIDAATDYRRCLVAATIGKFDGPAHLSHRWYLSFTRPYNQGDDPESTILYPGESPHYVITASDGETRLAQVTWYGRCRTDTPPTLTGEGGVIEVWVDDRRIHTFHSAPVSGEANNQFPVTLPGDILVPGQEIYFRNVAGEWHFGGDQGSTVSLLAASEHPNKNMYWPA